LERGLDLVLDEFLHDLWTATDESCRVEECIEFRQDGFEVGVASDPFDEVVGLAFLLDDRAGLVRKDAVGRCQ
jgi:hypothetical protein